MSAELMERVGWRTVRVRGERPRQGSGSPLQSEIVKSLYADTLLHPDLDQVAVILAVPLLPPGSSLA